MIFQCILQKLEVLPCEQELLQALRMWVTFGSKADIPPPTTATQYSTRACRKPKVSFEQPRGLKT